MKIKQSINYIDHHLTSPHLTSLIIAIYRFITTLILIASCMYNVYMLRTRRLHGLELWEIVAGSIQ